MAVRASAAVTLSTIRDIQSVSWYYLLQPSAAAAPAKPTAATPPTITTSGYSGWSASEPSYTSGDTRSLYVTEKTVYTDGTFEYTTPTLSSSYEAAKQAYNKAQIAQENIDNLSVGSRNLLLGSEKMTDWHRAASYCSLSEADGFGVISMTGRSSDWGSMIHSNPTRPMSWLNGDPLIVSFEYLSTEDCMIGMFMSGTSLQEGLNVTTQRSRYVGGSKEIPSSDGAWKKYTSVLTGTSADAMTSGSGDVTSWYFQIYCRTQDAVFQIRKVKLEHGTKATDWSPAPEDVEQRIQEASDEAKKTATNFLSADSLGIMVADMRDGEEQTPSNPSGRNVLIDNDSVDIRKGSDVLASFGENAVIGQAEGWHQRISSEETVFAYGDTVYTYLTPGKILSENMEVKGSSLIILATIQSESQATENLS